MENHLEKVRKLELELKKNVNGKKLGFIGGLVVGVLIGPDIFEKIYYGISNVFDKGTSGQIFFDNLSAFCHYLTNKPFDYETFNPIKLTCQGIVVVWPSFEIGNFLGKNIVDYREFILTKKIEKAKKEYTKQIWK